MKLPRFTAETSIRPVRTFHRGRPDRRSRTNEQDAVIPAQGFRVTCPGNTALGFFCTLLGGTHGWWCFGNNGCMWAVAGALYPSCFRCSHN
jgi:hypothetical protein